MDMIHLIIIILLAGFPVCIWAECPDLHPLIMEMEGCFGPLDKYTGHALAGTLNNRRKTQACRHFDEAMVCVDDLTKSCNGYYDKPSLDAASEFKEDKESGFGKICKNEEYFSEYTSYAHCYKEVSEPTEVCLLDFHNADETVDMCGPLTDMRKCVDKAVEPCGKDAQSLYFELCRHQVPSTMFTHCYATPLARESTTPSTSSALRAGSHACLPYMVFILLLAATQVYIMQIIV